MIGRASVIRVAEEAAGCCEVWSLAPETAASLARDRVIQNLQVHGFRAGLQAPEYVACAAALASSTSLTRLSIEGYNAGFGDAGFAALGASARLTELNASALNIGCAGVLGMLHNRPPPPPLLRLALPFNVIGDAGAAGIGTLLHLTKLNLRCNNLGDAATPALAALPSLESLDVSFNRISPTGGAALLRSASLRYLDFQLNSQVYAGAAPGDVDCRALHTALHLNFSLESYILAWHEHNYVRRYVGVPRELLRGRAAALAGRASTRHFVARLPLWALRRLLAAMLPVYHVCC